MSKKLIEENKRLLKQVESWSKLSKVQIKMIEDLIEEKEALKICKNCGLDNNKWVINRE